MAPITKCISNVLLIIPIASCIFVEKITSNVPIFKLIDNSFVT